MSLSFFYNDLLFEIYHYIPKSNISQLNKSCKRMKVINGRIKRYIYHKKYDKANDGLCEVCKIGDIGLVKLMIEKGANYWNWGLKYACLGGSFINNDKAIVSKRNCHMKIVKLMIKKGANDWNWGLVRACGSGNMKIVRLMIKKGANEWNWGLYNACSNGNMKIVKLMIKNGATQCNYCNKSMQEHLLKK